MHLEHRAPPREQRAQRGQVSRCRAAPLAAVEGALVRVAIGAHLAADRAVQPIGLPRALPPLVRAGDLVHAIALAKILRPLALIRRAELVVRPLALAVAQPAHKLAHVGLARLVHAPPVSDHLAAVPRALADRPARAEQRPLAVEDAVGPPSAVDRAVGVLALAVALAQGARKLALVHVAAAGGQPPAAHHRVLIPRADEHIARRAELLRARAAAHAVPPLALVVIEVGAAEHALAMPPATSPLALVRLLHRGVRVRAFAVRQVVSPFAGVTVAVEQRGLALAVAHDPHARAVTERRLERRTVDVAIVPAAAGAQTAGNACAGRRARHVRRPRRARRERRAGRPRRPSLGR